MKTPKTPIREARPNVRPNVSRNVPREPSDVDVLSALVAVRAIDPFNTKVAQAIEKLAARIADKVLAS